MNFRLILCALCLVCFFIGSGCRKPDSSPPKPTPTTLAPDTIASVHWVGKHRIDLEADAYYFSRIWSLPETARLQSQTFDRLATGFWRCWLGDSAGAQISPAVLRPLLDVLAYSESYLEMRAMTGAPPCVVFTLRDSSLFSGVWETNLAVAMELLTGTPAVASPVIHGWTIQNTNLPAIQFSHVAGWALLSFGPPNNALAGEVAARIRRDGVPFVSAGTNLWFEASLDPSRLVAAFPSRFFTAPKSGEGKSDLMSLVSGFKSLRLTLSGDGANVITRADLKLAQPVVEPLVSWQLPLSLVHEPLTSFTAVRGIQSLLQDSGWWQNFSAALLPPPDQFYLWSLAGSPYQVYGAAPMPDAHQRVAALSDVLIQQGNLWLAAHGYISFDRAADGNGVTWGNLPAIRPFLKSAGVAPQGWLYAGLLPDNPTNPVPPPQGMIQYLLNHTNLMYYDWEVTGLRLQPCLKLAQTTRLVARCPQLPADSASLAWLAALDPRLGTSATLVNRTGPDEFNFYRRSTIGLTASELQLLADWLESPAFPRGLYSTVITTP